VTAEIAMTVEDAAAMIEARTVTVVEAEAEAIDLKETATVDLVLPRSQRDRMKIKGRMKFRRTSDPSDNMGLGSNQQQ
jgi:hypothetical protein